MFTIAAGIILAYLLIALAPILAPLAFVLIGLGMPIGILVWAVISGRAGVGDVIVWCLLLALGWWLMQRKEQARRRREVNSSATPVTIAFAPAGLPESSPATYRQRSHDANRSPRSPAF